MPLILFTREDIPRICPHCRKELGTMLKCRYCSKLINDDVDKLKESSQDRIYGGIFCYVFSADKSKIAFVTGNAGSKNPGFYLYDIKSRKIIWANMKHLAASRMFYLEDRIIIVSRSGGVSSLESFSVNNGQSVSKIDKEETWTNMFQFENDFLIGFRDGFLYRYNKDLEIINSICLKEDPESKAASYYCNPAPFNIVMNLTEDRIAFSHERTLFLVDHELNILWEKDVGGDCFEFRREPSFSRNLTYTQQKYQWALNQLEIDPKSDLGQIKRAFRNKAMQWHPDRHFEENKDIAEAKFKEIVRAYELLTENEEDTIREELHEMGLPRSRFVFLSNLTRISEINFWQQEETNKIFIEVRMDRGTDKFFDLEGKIISDKAEIGFSKTNRVKHAKESYGSVNTQRELKWSLREGGFWFRPMGVKLYQDIQDGYFLRYDQKKAEEFLNSLDLKIDFWDTFISEKINEIKKSDEFKNLKYSVCERDKNRCAACGNKRNTYFHNIFSLSEHIAKHILEQCSNIDNLEIGKIQSFYDLKNNLILCPKCYIEEYGESQIEYHLSCIGEDNSWSPIIGKSFPKSEDILDKAYRKMRICTKLNPRTLFSIYLSKIEEFEKEAAFSRRGRQILGEHQTIKIQLLFRLEEYDLAKRWAMRHERFLRKACDEIHPEYLGCEKDSFTANNWEKIVSRVIDKMIDSYKKGDYKLRYDWGYPKFGLKKYRKLFRDAEIEIKKEVGV